MGEHGKTHQDKLAYYEYPTYPEFTKKVFYPLPRIEFFDLPYVLKNIQEVYNSIGDHTFSNTVDELSWIYCTHIGNVMWRVLERVNNLITVAINKSELDPFWKPSNIPTLLNEILDQEYHNLVYAQLLEYFPKDQNLQAWYQQSLCIQNT